MVPGKMGRLVSAMLLCFARSVHAVGLNGDCTSAACDAGLTCESNVCEAIIGFACSVDGDCTTLDANAECSSSACACKTGYTGAAGDTCEAIIGFTCSVDGDCSTLDGNAVCSSSACACKTGYTGAAGDTCEVVIGSTCENNAACSSVLTNSECVIVYPCTKGVCACSSGYYETDCLTLGYDKTCSTGLADKCNTGIGLACDAGKCACSTNGETYRSEIGRCTDQKLLGETCTGSGTGDCYTTSNTECDTTCKCSSGYYQDGQACRRPYGGETCSTTCDKVPTAAILNPETSQQTPTCTASKCACGSYDQVSRKIGSTCYTVCLSTGGGTTAVGQTCAKFNDCESKVCAECPGDAGPKCYNAPCSGSTFSGSILVCSIILFSIFI